MMAPTKTASSGGCGCSGKAAAPASPCGCGGNHGGCTCGGKCGCEESCPGEFRRPNFFEGQLLTEDDLQALGAYAVEKNRLHMRHFWGDGVVCGLDVKLHPCSKSKLIVDPGYALDCCGNDLVLGCPKELDIRQMIRDLQAALLGADCGDPCPEEKPCGDEDTRPATAANLPGGIPTPPGTPAPVPAPNPPPARSYCLYIRYCEQGVEPTTAYGTGQNCGAPACYPTRIQEGVRFELRCCEKPKTPDDLVSRLCRCLEKQTKDPAAEESLRGLMTTKLRWAEALEKTASGDFALDTVAFQTAADRATALPEAVEDRAGLDAVLDAGAELMKQSARFYVVPAKQRPALNVTPQLVKDGRATLAKLRTTLDTPKAKELIAAMPELEREYTLALVDRIEKVSKFTDNSVLKEEDRALTQGTVINDALLKQFSAAVERTESMIPKRVTLSRPVAAPVSAPKPAEALLPSAGQVQALIVNADSTLDRLRSAFEECFCDNLNPPCLPCDDQAVLLACFKWADCEIKDLCILVRKFVLTPNNLRYWLPAIGEIGKLLESLCCPGGCREEDDKYWTASRSRFIAFTSLLSIVMGPRWRECIGYRTTGLTQAADRTVSRLLVDSAADETVQFERAFSTLLARDDFRTMLKESLK